MSGFTYIDLREARDSRKMTRVELANAINISESTLERWESGKKEPHPDEISDIEKVLCCPGLWHSWMLSHYRSYRERYRDIAPVDSLTAAIVQLKHEITDVLSIANNVERDTLDGKLDDLFAAASLKKEALEAIASIRQTLDKLPD